MRVWKGVYVAACVSGLALAQAATPAPERDPRLGTWVEKKVSSSYQGLRRSFEDLGGGLTRVGIALDSQGAPRSSSDLRCDGKAYPVVDEHRQPTDVTLSCHTLDARTTQFTFRRTGAGNGWVTSTGTERVSEDGQTYSVSAVQTDAQGKIVNRIERLFERQR
jgi:hypothetical protein